MKPGVMKGLKLAWNRTEQLTLVGENDASDEKILCMKQVDRWMSFILKGNFKNITHRALKHVIFFPFYYV